MTIRKLLGALLMSAIGLASAPVANGAAYRLAWDPLFSASGSLNNLGWQGEGEVVISDDCFNTEGLITVGIGSCTSATFTSLTVELYNYADSLSSPPPDVLETLTFVPHDPPLSGGITGLAIQILVSPPGTLEAIKTSLIGPIQASAITSGGGDDPLPADSLVSIQFFAANFDIGPFTVDPQVKLKVCDLQGQNCQTSDPATVSFTIVSADVPEPGTVALVLAALLAVAGTAAKGRLRRRPGS
jgi:hypothetical protein